MIEQAVVSCPSCLRQYEIDATSDHCVAQCSRCKSHFVLVVSRLTGPSEGALVLEKEVEPRINFFKEACETLAKNVCDLLVMAGVPVSPRVVLEIVKSIPRGPEEMQSEEWRERALNRVLRHVFINSPSGSEQPRRLIDYFLWYIPDRSYFCQDMLRAAFEGVLAGIAWPEPGPPNASVPLKESRPKLFTWLRRRAADRALLAHSSRGSSKPPIS